MRFYAPDVHKERMGAYLFAVNCQKGRVNRSTLFRVHGVAPHSWGSV